MKYFIALLSLNVEELLLIAVFSFNQQYARSWEYTNTETVSICFSFPLCSSTTIGSQQEPQEILIRCFMAAKSFQLIMPECED